MQNISKKDEVMRKINYSLMILFALLCIGLCIYYYVIGDPNNRVLATIGVSLLFVLPMFLELVFRCRISNLIVLCYVIYCVLAGLLGCVFNFYNIANFNLNVWYDIFIHCLAGYVFCFIGLIIISRFEKYKNLNPWTILFFCIFFSLATELVWELMEWFADNCLGQNSQGFAPTGQPAPLVTDTNIDMLCNFSGVALFIIHFVIGKFTKVKLGMNYIEEELCGKKVLIRKPKKNKEVNAVDENKETESKDKIEQIDNVIEEANEEQNKNE